MSAVDDVVELLRDGEWHNLQDLAKNLKLNQQELHEIIQFLQNLDLIRIDEKQQKAQINIELKRLITPRQPKQTS
jgi:DNA-binding IclR family transcriptional regulator